MNLPSKTVVGLCVLVWASVVHAALIAYEPFNYTSGGQVNASTAAPTGTPNQTTAGGWTGNWSGAATVNAFGLAYPGLPTGNRSITSLGANNVITHIASAPTTGSVWVSFLFKQTSDNGGNRSGVFFENSSGAGVMLSYQQYSGSQGEPCLMAMSSTTTVGTQLKTSTATQTYANTNLYVLRFDYTAGVVTTVAVYSNPTAGQNTAPSPDFTVTTGLPSFGALVNFGLYDGSAMGITLDEFRVADSFGDAVGVSLLPVNVSITSPTNSQTVSIHGFAINAAASVVPGSVTNVDFYVDSVWFTNVTASPFNCTVSGVSAGAHALTAVATDSGGNTATSSVVNVTVANLAPSVTLTNPAPASKFLTGSAVTLGASATDDDAVTNVDFYVDGELVGSAATSPYTTTWIATAGAHALTAVATDNDGLSTTSAAVNITGTLPTVSITSPTDGQTVSIYNYTVSASATVSPGTITNVDLYVDGAWFANATASPYRFAVTAQPGGAHTLQAVATDSNGNSVTSSVVNVTAQNLPPSVALTNAVSQFLVGSTVTIGASAADDNAVTNVAFYVDGGLIGNSATNPYVATWIATAGVHAVTAVATDNDGLSTTSAEVDITGVLPVVSITSPTNSQTVSIYTFSINASATVSPGSITNVAFYVDGAWFTNQTATPFNCTVSGASAGDHELQVVATDSNGNSVTSSVVNVTAADLPPSVTLTNPVDGSSVLVGSGVTLGATATDDSAVTNVDFYVDGLLVGSSATSPYSATWGVTSLGAHAVFAVATDNAGQTSTSTVANVTAVLNFNAYESFNYTSLANGTSTTGTGFAGNWLCGAAGTIVSGLTYNGLPTTNSALKNTGSYQLETLANPQSSGVVWVSVLFQQTGDNGGNRSGFVFEDNTGKGLMLSYNQSTGTAGFPCLVNISSTNTVGAQLSTKSSTLRTYNTANLYVLKLTYTAGALTSVSVYSDPTAGQATAPTADFTVSSLTGIGVISRFGANSPSGMNITIDEIRTGTSFGSVVGVALPDAPTDFIATPGNSQVSLSWTAPDTGNPTGYNVKRSTTNGWNYAIIGTTSNLNFIDATAVNGTTYYYVVSGTNAAGEGANSIQVSATPTTAPAQPQDLVAYPGVNSVGLSWTPVDGASGYLILRGTESGVYTVTNSSDSNTNFDATAAGGTTYYYVVQATNAGGVSVISAEVSAQPTNAVPSAPASLSATPTSGQVSLSWSVGVGATGYNVKRATTSGAETTIATAAGTSFVDVTAINGNFYYYTVSATNASGESVDSVEATAALPPAAPTGLNATPGANQVSLTWTPSAGVSGALSYNVKRSTTSGSGYATIANAPTPSFSDTTAISGTTYYYVVSGVNASGQGDNSTEASATPTGVPQAPTGVTLSTNYTSLTLSWTAAAGAPTSYNVKRSTSSGAETTLPAGANVSGTTFTDTTVVTGTQYFYTVSAVNGDGEGADSTEVTGTAPGTPSAYESFNYGSIVDGTPTTGTGFTGNWSISNSAPAIVDGLTFPNLYTSNSAFQVTSGNQLENLSVPLSSGSVYVSFLYVQNGDFGGNRGGLELLNSAGSGVMFAYHQFGAAVGLPSLDAVTGYTSVGSELGVSTTPQTYATANLYVLRLDYNNGGTLTNIAFYSNPAIGQGAPTPDFAVSSGLNGIGAITAIGMHVGLSTTVDEWRVGTTWDEVVVGKSVTPITLGNLDQTYDGTAKVVTASTTPDGLTVNLTYDGSTDAPTNAGTYQVIATLADNPNYYGSVTNNLVIEQATATVSLDNLSWTYDGTAKVATASTTPDGLSVDITYDGLTNAPTDAGTYTVVATVSDANYQGSATDSLVIGQATATVTLGNLNQPYDGNAKNVTVTTVPSGLTVVVTYDGSTDAPINAGTYQVVATVVDNNYQGSTTNTLTVGGAFGSNPGSVTLSGGNATVVLSGVEGLNYSVERATDAQFTQGVTNFPAVTATTGGNVSVTDDFSDLGAVPPTAFYRLQYLP